MLEINNDSMHLSSCSVFIVICLAKQQRILNFTTDRYFFLMKAAFLCNGFIRMEPVVYIITFNLF